MAHQIVYTSVPRGLTPGSKGYCTVVASNGMAPALQRQLESLSQYNHIYPPNTANDTLNPTNFQYSKASFGGKQLCVLSRVSDAGLDYSRRSNLLAHHVALEPDECKMSGPAALMENLILPPSVKTWEKPPQRLDLGAIPNPACPTSPMTSHSSLGIKPEVVGELAGRLANPSQRIVTVLYRQEQHPHLMSLVTDLFWLMPPRDRWNTTFSTYYSADVQNTDCRLRFIPHGTPNAERVMLEPGTIDLNQNMTVLDSEFVQAAKEAARTGNRTLAHPRVAESAHSTGESFTRAQRHSSTPRPPIGGPELHLQPPPIAQPATQTQSNQDRHKTLGKFSENQDRHSSGARKKLVIAISVVTTFLLLGIIAIVALNNAKMDSPNSETKRRNDDTGNHRISSTQGNSGHDLTTDDNQNQRNGDSDTSNQDRHNTGETGNQDSHDTVGEDGGNGGEASQDSAMQVQKKTLYVVDLKRKEAILESIDQLRSGQDFHTQVSESEEDLLQICNMRIVLLMPDDSKLSFTQEDNKLNVVEVGLKQDGADKLLRIELTDDPNEQLIWRWNEALDDMADQKERLKNALTDELIKTVLLVPYRKDAELESGFDSKVRMRVVAFGTVSDNVIELEAFPKDGYHSLNSKDSLALATAVESASTTEGSLLRVTATLPKYDSTTKQVNTVKTITLKSGNGQFDIPSFWGDVDLKREKDQQNYVPQISLQLDLKDESDVTIAFFVSEVRRAVANSDSTSDVFDFLNGLSITEYVWDENKYIPKPAPSKESKEQRAQREANNINVEEQAKEYHRRTSLILGRGFLQQKPTSTYQVIQSAISMPKLTDWTDSSLSFQLKTENGMRLSEIPKLKSTIKISEQLFDHLPNFSKAQGVNLNDVFIDEFSLLINRSESKPISFTLDAKNSLRGFKNLCVQHIKSKSLEHEKLEAITDSLINWAKTLHGVIRINQNLTNNGIPIQLQIEVQQSFKLPSTFATGDSISMANDSKPEGKNSDDLIVPILRLGHVEAINN